MERGVVVRVILAFICYFDSASATPSSSPLRINNLDPCHPLVIAHRGASGFVPEHTLGAYALAITMGSDYIEPDLVMTKDGHLIARHENELSLTTDVSQHPEFANRYRTQSVDGRQVTGWFTEDFTLAEIKTLRARELLANIRPGNTRMDDSLQVATMQEIIDLVKGMQLGENRVIGIYPEIKHPTHFQNIGLAMEQPLVDLLHKNGYSKIEDPIYIQSFEVSNLIYLKNITNLRLLQLFAGRNSQPFDQVGVSNLTYGMMATAAGLKDIAEYAYAVGPAKDYIIPRTEDNRLGTVTSFVTDAHNAGLFVHPYTFRAENFFLPIEYRTSNDISAIGNLSGELSQFFAADIDGAFVDQPNTPIQMREFCVVNLPSSSTNLYIQRIYYATTISVILFNVILKY